ncbi:MAG TPA: NB-ARC domain-containing protein [Rhizomicrobium sp.]|nr:NB-ARC domain-containing protein [Rhizomicrobium sp.]
MSTTLINRRTILFFLVEAIERDLRAIIARYLVPNYELQQLFGQPKLDLMVARYQKDRGPAEIGEPRELLNYCDLGDAVIAIESRLGPGFGRNDGLGSSVRLLKKLPLIRHRIVHFRPLEFSDFDTVSETAQEIAKKNSAYFPRTLSAVETLRDNPQSLIAFQYSGIDEPVSRILHNLPNTDFDDTGYFARDIPYAAVRKAIFSAFPVVTLVGEGGVGKTALSLKVSYDLLDDPKCPFELVIWVSAKTKVLTAAGVMDIQNAISTSIGLFEAAATNSGLVGSAGDPITSVTELLRQFPTLLILDNLETVKDEIIEHFLENVPSGSKVLITSRISLGKLDYPIKLGRLDKDEATRYFRTVCSALNVNSLQALAQHEVQRVCGRLQYNPLWIKWFVQAVRAGARKEELLSSPKEPLAFCLENVFEKVSPEGELVLDAMLCVGGSHSVSTIAFLTGLDALTIREVVNELTAMNAIVAHVSSARGEDTRYSLEEIVRNYLYNYQAPDVETQAYFRRKRDELHAIKESLLSKQRDVFDWRAIWIANDSNVVTAKLLTDANRLISVKRFEEARKIIDAAEAQSPGYFEVYRVRAFLAEFLEDFVEVRRSFKQAIELAPGHTPLYLWFGRFLWRHEKDYTEARQVLVEGLKSTQDFSIAPFQRELATISMVQKDFETAREYLGHTPDFSSLSAIEQRKMAKTKIGFFIRHAEFFRERGQFAEVLEELVKFHAEFVELNPYVDFESRESFEKAAGHYLAAKSANLSDDQAHQLFEEVNWFVTNVVISDDTRNWLRAAFKISAEVSETRETIASESGIVELPKGWRSGWIKLRKDRYGFLKCSDGAEYMFPYSALRGSLRISDLTYGDKYIFRIGLDQNGASFAMELFSEQGAAEYLSTGAVSRPTSFGAIGSCQFGEIKILHDSYGFIESESGEYLYFNSRDVSRPNPWLDVGARVNFIIANGLPNRSRAATKIKQAF